MKVKVQFYDDKPLSASVPNRVTCIVKEEIAATPRYISSPEQKKKKISLLKASSCLVTLSLLLSLSSFLLMFVLEHSLVKYASSN